MEDKSLTPVISRVESLFSTLNQHFFNGELQKPVITIAPDTTKGAYGWCTSWKAWTDKAPKAIADMTAEEIAAMETDGFYEINLCAEHIARSFTSIVETLLHEMCHLYNLQIGKQDTSRGGYYHNRQFADVAESHGLKVEKTPKYGYSKTSLTDEAKAFVLSLGDTKFELYRKPMIKNGSNSKKKQSTRKYVCPCCGTIIRATREVNVICGDCNISFEQVD